MGETGCQRTVSPFSRSRTRHWSRDVPRSQRQRAAAPAGGLSVQPKEQGVQLRVIARGRGEQVDLGAPQGALLYSPHSGHGLEEVSLDLMADP